MVDMAGLVVGVEEVIDMAEMMVETVVVQVVMVVEVAAVLGMETVIMRHW